MLAISCLTISEKDHSQIINILILTFDKVANFIEYFTEVCATTNMRFFNLFNICIFILGFICVDRAFIEVGDEAFEWLIVAKNSFANLGSSKFDSLIWCSNHRA